MKFYSETLKKTFDSAEECLLAEKKVEAEERERKLAEEKKNNERKARADEINAAYNVMVEAQHAYSKLVDAFVKDYGTYHLSTSNISDIPHLFFNLFNL